MTDPRDSDAALLEKSGRARESAGLTTISKKTTDPLQAMMGCPAPVWENQDSSKLSDGGCVIFNGARRCGKAATHAAWIGCTVGEHLDRSDVCEAHAAMLGRDTTSYSCRRCWDAVGEVSKAKVIKVEAINDDDEGTASPTGQSADLLP